MAISRLSYPVGLGIRGERIQWSHSFNPRFGPEGGEIPRRLALGENSSTTDTVRTYVENMNIYEYVDWGLVVLESCLAPSPGGLIFPIFSPEISSCSI